MNPTLTSRNGHDLHSWSGQSGESVSRSPHLYVTAALRRYTGVPLKPMEYTINQLHTLRCRSPGTVARLQLVIWVMRDPGDTKPQIHDLLAVYMGHNSRSVMGPRQTLTVLLIFLTSSMQNMELLIMFCFLALRMPLLFIGDNCAKADLNTGQRIVLFHNGRFDSQAFSNNGFIHAILSFKIICLYIH